MTPSAIGAPRSVRPPLARASIGGFLLVYAILYGAYGTSSPYFSAFLQGRQLVPNEISTILAAGIVARLIAGPFFGRMADHLHAPRGMLAIFVAVSGLVGFGYLAATGFWLFLIVHIIWAGATAPVTSLADALAVRASDGGKSFDYGWVRGTGSAAFVAGTLLSGQAIGWFGRGFIVSAMSVLFLALVVPVLRVPNAGQPPSDSAGTSDGNGFKALFGDRVFRALILVAALIGGSHALNDTFAVVIWEKAGIGNGVISVLWSTSVVAEIIVFLVLGRPIVDRLGPATSIGVAAIAGAVRWSAMAVTTAVPALVAIQALHGLSFALMHLAAMAIIARIVPVDATATAQTVYGSFGVGSATALMTAASGPLFGTFGSNAFWAMVALCLAALPLTRGLRDQRSAAAPALG